MSESTGTTGKKRRRERVVKFTPDGLPRDTRDWTVEDWRDLHEGIEEVKRRIARRHQQREQNP